MRGFDKERHTWLPSLYHCQCWQARNTVQPNPGDTYPSRMTTTDDKARKGGAPNDAVLVHEHTVLREDSLVASCLVVDDHSTRCAGDGRRGTGTRRRLSWPWSSGCERTDDKGHTARHPPVCAYTTHGVQCSVLL